MLAAREPAFIAWGPQLTCFYNDGYLPMLGSKHPGIGKPFETLWAELWGELSPLVSSTLTGRVRHFEDMPLSLTRPGRPEGFFSFANSPLRDDAGHVAGFHCSARETTDEVLNARRQSALLAASERLVRTRSVQDGVEVLRDSARAAVGADGIAVVFKEPDRCVYVADDANAPLWSGQVFPADACVSGWAMRHGETVSIADVARDPRVPQDAYASTFVGASSWSLLESPSPSPSPRSAPTGRTRGNATKGPSNAWRASPGWQRWRERTLG